MVRITCGRRRGDRQIRRARYARLSSVRQRNGGQA